MNIGWASFASASEDSGGQVASFVITVIPCKTSGFIALRRDLLSGFIALRRDLLSGFIALRRDLRENRTQNTVDADFTDFTNTKQKNFKRALRALISTD